MLDRHSCLGDNNLLCGLTSLCGRQSPLIWEQHPCVGDDVLLPGTNILRWELMSSCLEPTFLGGRQCSLIWNQHPSVGGYVLLSGVQVLSLPGA